MTKIQSEVSGFTPRKQLNDSEIKTNSNPIIPLNLITKINKRTNYKTRQRPGMQKRMQLLLCT